MSEFEKLIGAAKQGKVEEVRAVLCDHVELINQRDSAGATALHYAAFAGHRCVVEELVKQGADVNARDAQFGATPAGWAIEYLREMGGFLGIELEDFAHAIRRGRMGQAIPDALPCSSRSKRSSRKAVQVACQRIRKP